MIIGYDMRIIGRFNSGVGLYTINLIRAILRTGEEIYLKMMYTFHNKKSGYMIRCDDYRSNDYVINLPNKILSGLWAFFGWPPAERFIGDVDILHSTNYTLIPSSRARRVITIHDLSFLIFPEFANKGARVHFRKKISEYCRRADQIWADSINTKRDIVEMLAIPEEKIEIIYPIISTKYQVISDKDGLNRSLKSIGLTRPYILYVGNIEPRKNLVRLIEAYEKSAIAHDYNLAIAGAPGWSNKEIHDKIKSSTVKSNIVNLGYLSDDSLVNVYNGARYLIYPSLYEGFGMPPFESICCGTPVIAGNNSSLPEVVGEAGILIDPYNIEEMAATMKMLAYDDPLLNKLRANCHKQSQKFNEHEIASAALAAYKKLL